MAERPIDAAVFDMDGTLVFNMRFHAEAWVEVAAEEGLPGLSVSLFEHEYAGLKNDELIERLFREQRPGASAVPAVDKERIARVKEARYQERYRLHLAPAPGLLSLLDRLHARGVPCAVATAAPRDNRDLVLDGLDLRRRFEVVVGAEQVKRGKPAPDLFLAAMAELKASPARCVIFEDAPNGVLAAVAAGATCIGITSVASREQLLAAGATTTIDAYEPLPAEAERLIFGT